MKKNDERYVNRVLAKYGCLYIYDLDLNQRYTIDHEYICFVKKYGYNLIDNLDHPDGTSTHREYFFINGDLFDQILTTNQNDKISLNIIIKNLYLPSINDISTYPRNKLRNRY